MKDGIMSVTKRPTAVKNNSINFAYNGNGIQDFFLDGISLRDRLANEVKVVGNTRNGTKPDEVDQAIRAIGNIPDNEDPLVFYSGDGGIYFFTKGYEEDSEANMGDISKIFINGKPLSEIIGTSSSMDSRLDEYKTKVNVQAAAALGSVTNANNLSEIKAALTTFFTNIQDN